MKSRLIAFALCTVTAGVVLAYPLRPPVAPPAFTAFTKPIGGKPKIEVVFVLDTTSSMGGLIQAAKENIWSIASSMSSAQPAPEIKMGLVAFRDRGDDYVTKVVDLSPDLDTMYATLMDFQPQGGGDGPESVNQALADAVNRISWSQDPSSYKVIFLVGDAAPHMDYPDDVKYPDTLKTARARGIVVNTIQAGNDPSARAEWQQIASLNQGAFFQVEQSGNAVAMATPYDESLAALSRDLDGTRMFYGSDDERRAARVKEDATGKLQTSASAASLAKRAEFNASAAGAKNAYGSNELVDDVSSGRVDLATLDAAKLPEPLRELKKEEQEKVVRANVEKREQITAQIGELSKQRQAFIADKLAASGGAKDSLDAKIYGAVKEQAAKKGLAYGDAPKY
jgi:Mg-chelatase subunit ChlD